MAIKFRVIGRGQPGVVGGGTVRYYASAVSNGEQDIDGLTKSIEKISTVSGADIRAVLYSLVEVAADELADGKIVRLGDLGSIRISVSSNGFDEEGQVNASAIKGNKVLFTPGKKLKEMQKNLSYKKA